MPKLQLVELDDRFWVPEASPERSQLSARDAPIKYMPAYTNKITVAMNRAVPMPRSPRSQETLDQLNKLKAELIEALEKLDSTEKKRKQNSARVLELAERLGKSDEREKLQNKKIREQSKKIEKLEDEITFHRNLVLSLKAASLPADKIIELTSASNFTQPLDSVREEGESPYRSPHGIKEEVKDGASQAKRALWSATANQQQQQQQQQPAPGAPVEEGANETSQAPCGPRNSQEEAQAKQQPGKRERVCSLSPKRMMPLSVQVKFDTMVENNLLLRVVFLLIIYLLGVASSHFLTLRTV